MSKYFHFLLAICIFAGVPIASAKNTSSSSTKSLTKKATNDVYHPMLINNIFNYYSNNGDGSFNPFSASAEGFEFPKGDYYATCLFEDGIVWGCKQNGTIKVGGSTYWHGLQAGPIVTNGTSTTSPIADDPTSSTNKLYRVRRDLPPISGVTNPDDSAAASELAIVKNTELSLISRYESGTTAEAILSQYWADWNNWPATKSAPFNDVDSNGIYDPTIDIPGVPQADQTIWYVVNDLDANRVANLAGSLPLGLEMQKTIWAYNRGEALANTIFSKTKLINKSGKALDSMYIAQWADPDLGDATDDLVGCDTTLNLGYAYNGRATDANFASYSLIPPAVGFQLIQGPMVRTDNASDTAIFASHYRTGFKNLPMTAFNFFIGGNVIYSDPPGGMYGSEGTTMWYNLLHGLIGKTGAPYINPITNQSTTCILSGDPVARTGWIDGSISPPADRRLALCSGPFTMAAGDTQEVVVATIAARGNDYLSSVTALKSFATQINPPSHSHTTNISTQQNGIVPNSFALAQNYPNPFNPTTTINFTIPASGNVSLKVYDVLGREVAVLANGVMAAGTYSKVWNAFRFASGVYFYRLQAGNFTQTKKLSLLN